MGGGKYSKTKGDQFIEWLDSIEFEDDEEMNYTLAQIISECNARMITKADVEQTSKD